MRFVVGGLALAGAWLAACGNSGSTTAVDAGTPDAGNQADETCFVTTRATAPTSTDCADLKYTAAPCGDLDTFDIEHVYRCSDVDGAERMPSGVDGCTRKGRTVDGATDWWCESIVCVLLYDPDACTGDGYACPADQASQLAVAKLFSSGTDPSLPSCVSDVHGLSLCCK